MSVKAVPDVPTPAAVAENIKCIYEGVKPEYKCARIVSEGNAEAESDNELVFLNDGPWMSLVGATAKCAPAPPTVAEKEEEPANDETVQEREVEETAGSDNSVDFSPDCEPEAAVADVDASGATSSAAVAETLAAVAEGLTALAEAKLRRRATTGLNKSMNRGNRVAGKP